MIADLFKLRDTFSQGGNDWNNADDAIRNLDKKLLDQGIDLKSAFTDLYKPLEQHARCQATMTPTIPTVFPTILSMH